MVITFDGQFLLTVSEDGCLLIWKIIDKEGRALKSNRQVVHTEEVLITKADLEAKVCICVCVRACMCFLSSLIACKQLCGWPVLKA